MRFLTKFKANQTYNITQGCCCTAFILQAEKDARRGIVTFKNPTKRELSLIVATANFDTVKPKESKSIFAFESAMCLFKPCPILIAETAFLAEGDNFTDNDSLNRQILLKKESLILSKNWFHFLHGEKVEIIYDEKAKKSNLKFNGYLTEKEYQFYFNNP